jgi:DNA-binding NarL/FixJ family response regulator
MDGIAATAAICADPANAETRVLILTTFEEDDYVVQALRAGASGFIGKGSEPEEILRAVQAIHAGDALLSSAATRSLISRTIDAPPVQISPEVESLTEREREVLVFVARGRSNQEIADELFISPHTAKTHVNRIMAKVGAHDRAQLVILAYESGVVSPGS